MCCLGVFKRVVPFLLTFTAGLFIASFFINIGLPNLPESRRQVRIRENQRLRFENDQLRGDNARLKAENEMLRSRDDVTVHANDAFGDVDVFAVPPPPPVAPVAPTVNGKTKTVTLTVR
jgi:hypothetical protein